MLAITELQQMFLKPGLLYLKLGIELLLNNFLDIVLEALNGPQFCRPFLVVAPIEIILDPLVLLLDLVLDVVQVPLLQFFLPLHQL